ncbi:MAG: hypothetical protein QXM73_01325 [Candidatus Nezhaarchaeales archaeon]
MKMMLDMDIAGRKVVRFSVSNTDEVTIYHLELLKALSGVEARGVLRWSTW